MKKAIIVMLVISLAICFSACTGGSGEIPFTGEYIEDSSTTTTTSTTPADLNNSTSSTTAPSESNTATTVLVPLTTVPGGTVPTVVTTAYTTEFSTVDYTPLDITTTKPPVHTTYVNPTSNYVPTQSQGGNNNNNNNDEEETTAKKTSYVSVSSSDTILDIDSESGTITLYVWAEDFGIKMKKTSGGDAVININGEQQVKANYSVSEAVSDDDWITVTIEPKGSVAFVVDDVVTVTMPKGALLSTKSVSNNKFTSIIGSVI